MITCTSKPFVVNNSCPVIMIMIRGSIPQIRLWCCDNTFHYAHRYVLEILLFTNLYPKQHTRTSDTGVTTVGYTYVRQSVHSVASQTWRCIV
jgi:hypothetical protein